MASKTMEQILLDRLEDIANALQGGSSSDNGNPYPSSIKEDILDMGLGNIADILEGHPLRGELVGTEENNVLTLKIE